MIQFKKKIMINIRAVDDKVSDQDSKLQANTWKLLISLVYA